MRCLQSFGEYKPCDWHDECSSTVVSNNLRGDVSISSSKNKFVAYDYMTGISKSSKAKSGSCSSSSKSGKSSKQEVCTNTPFNANDGDIERIIPNPSNGIL